MNDKAKKGKIGFSFAWSGILEVMKKEYNFRFHLIATGIVILFGLFLKLEQIEWAIILLTIGLVLVAEILNSTVERVVDYLKPEQHPQAKIIKDVAASAVLLAAFIAVIVGLFIFIPKIIVMF